MLTRQDVEQGLTLLQDAGLVRLSRPVGSWYQIYCPFHNNGQERKPSCGCSLTEDVRNGVTHSPGTFHCFACGSTYSFSNGIKEILKIKGTSIAAHPELEPYINGKDDIQVDSLIPEGMMSNLLTSYAVDNLKIRTLNKTQYVSEEELASYRFTVPYMYQRRLTDEIIEKYDVGFDANHIPPGRSKPLPCVTFPVRDIHGRTLFICRRSIEGKYFNLPAGIEKSVYGLYELPAGTKEVIVCESVFNALTSVAYGHPAVALFGTGTQYEIEQLQKLGVSSYVLCLDNDEAGNRGTAKLKKALKNSAMVWTMHVPEGKDVNDLEYDEFIECYNNRE